MSEINLGVRYKATVVSTALEQDNNGKPYIYATLKIEDEAHSKRIYLTEAAMGIARAQLKAMGFDCDKYSLKEIDENPLLLQHQECEVDFKPWESNDGVVLQINGIYGKKEPKTQDFISKLDSELKAAKGTPTKKKTNPDMK